jgi:hypothetical protein
VCVLLQRKVRVWLNSHMQVLMGIFNFRAFVNVTCICCNYKSFVLDCVTRMPLVCSFSVVVQSELQIKFIICSLMIAGRLDKGDCIVKMFAYVWNCFVQRVLLNVIYMLTYWELKFGYLMQRWALYN